MHTAKWARKLPNWSGSLSFLDRIVFAAGAEYSFSFLKQLRYGRVTTGKTVRMIINSFFNSMYQITKNSDMKLDYYKTTKKAYPVLEKMHI